LSTLNGILRTVQLQNPLQLQLNRSFTPSLAPSVKQLPPRRVILDSEIEENFLKGSGPGGQKINKTSSAVQLKHLPTGIVVKCQETRSRSQNRKIARKILGERIEELELGEQSRKAIKAKEASRKRASADKKKRRKYRQLSKEDESLEGREEDYGDTSPRETEDSASRDASQGRIT
jgi:peptide chain release factor